MTRAKDHPEWNNWRAMRERCLNPDFAQYADYGGRGITVCAQWATFQQFYEDVGPKPSPKHTLDRIDNIRGYEPGNVRWATGSEQRRNSRRKLVILTAFGKSQPISDWATELGIPITTLWSRIFRDGKTHEQALGR